MKKLLLPIILLLVGVGSGVGAGLFLKPPTEMVAHTDPENETSDDHEATPTTNTHDDDHGTGSDNEFAKLSNQFIVPLVVEGQVTGLVVMTMSLEVPPGGIEAAFAIEPRIRDGFLQVLFDHANVGGFSGNFTDIRNMRTLREELLRSAKFSAGDKVADVLILDIVRQDL